MIGSRVVGTSLDQRTMLEFPSAAMKIHNYRDLAHRREKNRILDVRLQFMDRLCASSYIVS